MKQFIPLVFMALTPFASFAQTIDAPASQSGPAVPIAATVETNLNDFLWVARPVVVFADSAQDPRFKKQMLLLAELPEELHLRDVVVITDTNPSADTPLREALRPRGFMLVLVSKDGTVLLRKPIPWTVRELTRSIDKLPARQQEMRDRRETNVK
ncbi:DUF4174 domain-containing protein [Profundibacter sp.]